MKRSIIIFFVLLLAVSCKKPQDRSCWKSIGEDTTIVVPLDSVRTYYLGKNIKYRIFEDTLRKAVIKGGKNLLNEIDFSYNGYELTISNNNKCNFLRDYERIVEVELHQPEYYYFYMTASDSVIFENTIQSHNLEIEMKEAGGEMVLDVDNYRTDIVVSVGTANYVITGHSSNAEIKVQDKGFADASGFTADNLFGFQNSTSDLYLNLDSSNAEIIINGTGDIYYTGTPLTMTEDGVGSGQLIQK